MQIIHQSECMAEMIVGRLKGCDDGEHDTALHCYHQHQGRA